FLQTLKSPGGAPEVLPADARIWADLPARKAGQAFLWQDDITRWTANHDLSGLEVVVRDCPVDRPEGVSLPPLACLSRGPDRCPLGAAREELLGVWQIKEPMLAEE